MPLPHEVLTRAFQEDPNAMHSLMTINIPCNESLADDAFIIVNSPRVLEHSGDKKFFQVGMIGVINGILTCLGSPLVAIKFSEPDESGVRRIVGFCEYVAPPSIKQIDVI